MVTLALLAPAPLLAQMGSEPTPMALDLKKVPVGSWAEYTMKIGLGAGMTVKSRWALVARDANSNTIETSAEGPPLEPVGGKMLMKLVLVPDPVKSDRPVKQMVLKRGETDPMDMPLDLPGMPVQRFEKPDPKKLVGKETVKVAAGTFKASHYRDVSDTATIDLWISDEVPPLGVLKLTTVPKPGAQGPMGQPLPPVDMQLTAKGKDAKPVITKPAKPFDPAALRPGAPPAPAPAK